MLTTVAWLTIDFVCSVVYVRLYCTYCHYFQYRDYDDGLLCLHRDVFYCVVDLFVFYQV